MWLSVYGAGCVGLVTAACLARLGHQVTCIDRDRNRVRSLTDGEIPFLEPGLESLVRGGLADRSLTFTTDPRASAGTELAFVAVGTLDAAGAWTSDYVRTLARMIAADAALPRALIVRSTLMPGTACAIRDELRRIDPSIELAVNPEFMREGNAVSDFLRPDRLVVGVSGEDSAHVASLLRDVYATIGAPMVITDLSTAETVKLASNLFLATKITFANEVARLCAAVGADVNAAIDGIGLDKRIGRAFLSPGPGIGGSCLPSQAAALPAIARMAGADTPLMEAVSLSERSHLDWLVGLLEGALPFGLGGSRIAVLGLTFKAGTDDVRSSPALRLVREVRKRGAAVTSFDPALAKRDPVPELQQAAVGLRDSVEAACKGADAVVVATEWPMFGSLDWPRVRAAMRGSILVDTRMVVDVGSAEKAGLRVVGLIRRQGARQQQPSLDSIEHARRSLRVVSAIKNEAAPLQTVGR